MVLKRLKELLLHGWEIDETESIPEAKLGDDFYMDEIDFADLIMDIEDAFSIEVSDDFDFKNATIGSLAKYIEENI